MAHFLHSLAQHWHLSASEYWQLRLLCAIIAGPLLGVLCLILFTKRPATTPRVVQRLTQAITLRATGPQPL